jgi:integrase
MKQKFTKQYVDKLSCTKATARLFVRDTVCRGLCVEVRSTGGKTYYLSYRDAQGKQRLYKLANAADVSPTQARQLCEQARSQMAMGVPEPVCNVTTDDFFYLSYLPYVKTYKRSWDTDVSVYRTHIGPAIGTTALGAVSYDDVVRMMTGAAVKLSAGSQYRLYVLTRYMFNLAKRWEVAGVEHNPTDRYAIKQSKQHRERYLNRAETKTLLTAIAHSANPQLQYIVPMLLLTGARKREVLDAQWQDMDYERRFWRIPFTKSGRERHVPLSDAVLTLLARVPRYAHCDWVFPNPKTLKPFRSIYHSWHTARTVAGLGEVRMHDLRHSFASFLVNAGCSIYDVQKLLGHANVSMTQRYSHLSQERLLTAANTAGDYVQFHSEDEAQA